MTAQVRPHVALITTVAPAHLEFFPSIEAIADAKSEIFEGLEPGGVAVLNRDSEHHRPAACAMPRGRGAGADRLLRPPSERDWRLDELRCRGAQ